MTITVKASHAGVDFGHVQTSTFTDSFTLDNYLIKLIELGGWNIEVAEDYSDSVELVEGA